MIESEALIWARIRDLKVRTDSIDKRVASLEGKRRKKRSLIAKVKDLSTILSMISTAHGTLWPLMAAAIGLGWRIVSKALF